MKAISWKKFFVPCCETPGKPHLQISLPVLHASVSLLQRGRAVVGLSDTSHSEVLVWVGVSGSSAKPAEVTQLKNFALHSSSITLEGLLCCRALLSLIFCTYFVQVQQQCFLQAPDVIIIQL